MGGSESKPVPALARAPTPEPIPVPPKPLYDDPWRTFNDDIWTQQYHDKILSGLKDCFTGTKSVKTANVVLLGPINSWKSAFVNSILSIGNNSVMSTADSGSADKSYTTKMSNGRLQSMQIQDDNDSVFLDYIALDHTRINFTTKTYVVNFEPKSVEECPVQSINVKKKYQAPELALQPVAMFRDPFRQGKHKIVFCELQYFDEKPLACNSRQKCREFMKKVRDEDPWFGFEQEFFFVDDDGVPYDWDLQLKKPDLNVAFGLFFGKAVNVQREITEKHMKACAYAGLKIYGMNREAVLSQWEYQLGPLLAVEAGDQLHVSRYILRRLAEMYNTAVTFFNPKCARNTKHRSLLHANFSTKNMRKEGGIKYIHKALETIAKHDQETIMKYYDLEPGNDYKWRLADANYVPRYDNLVIKVGDKSDTTLRIPAQVDRLGKGYFEERRPSGEADPYDVSRILTAAALFEPNGILH